MAKNKPRIGDIFEVQTPAGLAYVQFTHEIGSMGQLIRVLPGLYRSRPENFGALARQKEMYFTFYPLRYAIHDKQVENVSHQDVPEWAKPYPMMRLHWGSEAGGRKVSWKIADASVRWTLEAHQRIPVVTELTPEQKQFSVHSIWTYAGLVKRLAQGWTPEREEELRLLAIDEEEAKQAAQPAPNPDAGRMSHYLYFPKKAKAEEAGRHLRERGFEVEVLRGAGRTSWLALAKHKGPESADQMERLRDDLESLAEKLDGEYDGWEAAVP